MNYWKILTEDDFKFDEQEYNNPNEQKKKYSWGYLNGLLYRFREDEYENYTKIGDNQYIDKIEE